MLSVQPQPGLFAVARLDSAAAIPSWVGLTASAGLLSITRTDSELSIVAPEGIVPHEVRSERSFRALRVTGSLDFNLTGILAQLTAALGEAGVPVFVISTFDTDYLLIRADRFAEAVRALQRAEVKVEDSVDE